MEIDRINRARQVMLALDSVPKGERPPPEIVAEAREALRDLADLLADIESDARRRAKTVREVRNGLAGQLYIRAQGLTVQSIGMDAGIGETSVRRAADQNSARRRRPTRDPLEETGEPLSVRDMHEEPPNQPNVARMYDYLLDGRHNFAVDRDTVDQVLATNPEIKAMGQQNRAFMARAVRLAARAGVRQFLDIGSGIPAQGNVHEIAQDIDEQARVLYVDVDAQAVTYGQGMLRGVTGVDFIRGDVRHPEDILASPRTRALIDFGRPVAVLLVSVLHFVPDDHGSAFGAVGELVKAMAPGSYLILSHLMDRPAYAGVTEATSGRLRPPGLRTQEQIERFFAGMEMVPPGLVEVPRWRPDTPRIAEATPHDRSWMLAGVAKKVAA